MYTLKHFSVGIGTVYSKPKELQQEDVITRTRCWRNFWMRIRKLQRKPRVNYIGQRFGDWLLLELLGQTESGSSQVYLCLCVCKVYKPVILRSLLSGKSLSCGHYKNYEGQKYGRLTLLKNLRKYKDKYTMYECLCDCGKIVKIRLSHILQGRIKSCNCLNRELSKERLYNPLLSNEDRAKQRNSKEYKEWRNAVLKRDGFKCILCFSTQDLVAHHLNNYIEYIELRTKLENGVCLCRPCHGKFHTAYKGNVNEKQFEEYKKLCQVH